MKKFFDLTEISTVSTEGSKVTAFPGAKLGAICSGYDIGLWVTEEDVLFLAIDGLVINTPCPDLMFMKIVDHVGDQEYVESLIKAIKVYRLPYKTQKL